MIIDVTGITLTPGNFGKDCKGNGKHYDEQGKLIERCCDECDYLLCCISPTKCNTCQKSVCPNSPFYTEEKYLERILELRMNNGYTKHQVAQNIGISAEIYSEYEKGRINLPLEILIRLTRLYNTTSDYILGLKNK